MARYIGPKTKIARKFSDPIFGPDKYFEKRKFPPGQHGPNGRRGKKSDYAFQLAEKQKIIPELEKGKEKQLRIKKWQRNNIRLWLKTQTNVRLE